MAAVAYLALVPLVYLLWGAFFRGDQLTLDHFVEAYQSYGLSEMVGNSILFAVGSTLLSMVIGTTLAYLAVRTDIPCKGLIFGAALIPLVIPGILHTISWIFLLSPQIGLLNQWADSLFGLPAFDIYSMPGMILVQGLDGTPIVFLLMYAGLRSMDPMLEESALMSGAGMGRVLREVTLPLMRPAIYTASLIMIVFGLEAFEVPALLGTPSNIWVFTSRIFDVLAEYPPQFGQAGAYATSLLLICAAGIYWQSRLQKRLKAFQTVTGKGFRPRPLPLGPAKYVVLALVLIYFAFAILLPALILLYASLIPFYASPSRAVLSKLTLDNYRYVLTSPDSVDALKHSVILAVGAATLVMVGTAVIAWLVVRTRIRGRNILDGLTFLPLTVPGLVLGVALLYVYLRFPLPIYGTLWILLIAYVTKSMPIGMRYATASMYQISQELEESAATSGATWLYTFRRVTLPLLMPGLVAGWLYLLGGLVRDVSTSLLLYSPGREVLGIRIWEMWQNGQFNELTALGVLLILFLVVLVAVTRKLASRIGIRDA